MVYKHNVEVINTSCNKNPGWSCQESTLGNFKKPQRSDAVFLCMQWLITMDRYLLTNFQRQHHNHNLYIHVAAVHVEFYLFISKPWRFGSDDVSSRQFGVIFRLFIRQFSGCIFWTTTGQLTQLEPKNEVFLIQTGLSLSLNMDILGYFYLESSIQKKHNGIVTPEMCRWLFP